MLKIAVALFVPLLLVMIMSVLHHRKQNKYLTTALRVDDETKEKAKHSFGEAFETAAIVGIPIIDVLYNTLKMNPHALAGINHLHHSREFDNLRDLVDFMKKSIHGREGGIESMLNQYKGYTGEERVFDQLRAEGHNVEVPDAPNHPGFDALVDGEPINVKITTTPGYINQHFEKYPDIKVYTNQEMSEVFAGDPNVMIADCTEEGIKEVTESTLEGIKNIGESLDWVPLISLVTSGAKNANAVAKGKKDVSLALEHTVLDVAGKGLGSTIGAKAGLALGMTLAPVTGGLSVALLPAIGAIGGLFGGKRIVGWWKGRHLREAKEMLQKKSTEFASRFLDCYEELVDSIVSPLRERDEWCTKQRSTENVFRRIFFPSLQVKIYGLLKGKLEEERMNICSFYDSLKNQVKESGEDGGLVLYNYGSSILNNNSLLLGSYSTVESASNRVIEEKNKLD